MAIRNAGIDDDNAFRSDDEAGVADAATIVRCDITKVANERVNIVGDANRFKWRCARERDRG